MTLQSNRNNCFTSSSTRNHASRSNACVSTTRLNGESQVGSVNSLRSDRATKHRTNSKLLTATLGNLNVAILNGESDDIFLPTITKDFLGHSAVVRLFLAAIARHNAKGVTSQRNGCGRSSSQIKVLILICSHKFATLMQFSYELLMLSHKYRLYLHLVYSYLYIQCCDYEPNNQQLFLLYYHQAIHRSYCL